MAEKNYPIPENPQYNTEIRQLQDSDPASATSIFNPLFQRLIENIHAIKLLIDQKVSDLKNKLDNTDNKVTSNQQKVSELEEAIKTLPPPNPPKFEIGEDGHLYAIYEDEEEL